MGTAKSRSRRVRTDSPVPRKKRVVTARRDEYAVLERVRPKVKRRRESAERRRSKDEVRGAVAQATALSDGKKLRGGRQAKGRCGPIEGSLRFAATAVTNYIGKTSIARAVSQLLSTGSVQDQRKHNRGEANLSELQKDGILTLIHDEWEKRHHVDYVKVQGFAKLVQTDAKLCALFGGEQCEEEEAWQPSDSWVAGFLKQWGMSSHKAQSQAASSSRPTMVAEEAHPLTHPPTHPPTDTHPQTSTCTLAAVANQSVP